jgi:hypothetical protein
MKIKFSAVLLFLFLFAIKASCQMSGYEYFIAVNGNLYLPIGNSGKGMYPILGYDKEMDTKVLIGGLGLGISAFKPVKNKVSLKGQANISKHTYWDEPVYLHDENGTPAGVFQAGASDYSLGITAMAHYFFKERLSIGTGLGGQILFVSLSRTPDLHNPKESFMVNRYNKPFIPVLPLEISYKSKRNLFNIRYEHGLLNRLKKGLQAYKKDKFGLFTFEVGFKIN